VSGAWRAWLLAVAMLGMLAAALPVLLFSSRLPEPIAIHWDRDFQPDGSAPQRAALLFPTVLIAGGLLLSLLGSGSAYAVGRAGRVAIVTLASGFAAATSATIVVRNLDRAVWSDAGSQSAILLAFQFGAPVALAALAYVLGRRAWCDVLPPSAARGPALPLADGARVYWTGSASNRWLLGISVYLLFQGFLLQALLPSPTALPMWLALHVLVFVVLEFFSHIRVTVDDRGLTVRYGHLRLWTRRVPLAEITAAQAMELDALAHGGWGYRGGLLLLGKAAIVVRSGAALRLGLRGGQTLFVTIDDAATAARLLTTLLERGTPAAGHARAPRPQDPSRA
jgi:hypothetical protein